MCKIGTFGLWQCFCRNITDHVECIYLLNVPIYGSWLEQLLQHLNKADDTASTTSGEYMQPMIYGRTSAPANYRNLHSYAKVLRHRKCKDCSNYFRWSEKQQNGWNLNFLKISLLVISLLLYYQGRGEGHWTEVTNCESQPEKSFDTRNVQTIDNHISDNWQQQPEQPL